MAAAPGDPGPMEHWEGQPDEKALVGLNHPRRWLAVAAPLGFLMLTLAFFLYDALELPWSAYDSWWGLIIIGGLPVMVGFAIGITFDRLKPALFATWGVSVAAAVSSTLLFASPYLMKVIDNTGKFTGHAWTGAFVALITILPLSAIGASLAVSSNIIE
jgi:hypothetical protein